MYGLIANLLYRQSQGHQFLNFRKFGAKNHLEFLFSTILRCSNTWLGLKIFKSPVSAYVTRSACHKVIILQRYTK